MRNCWRPACLPGLAKALVIGLCLIGLQFLAQTLAPCEPGEAHRAILRLRGALFLVAVTWYGRYILLPKARWAGFWWFFWPGLALLAVKTWPVWVCPRIFSFARGVILLAVFMSLVEQTAAIIRQVCEAKLNDIPSREGTLFIARRSAAALCFLIALCTGTGLFLLAVDYVFNYFIYSLFGAVLVLAVYLAPLVTLAARLEKSVTTVLAVAARREEAALAQVTEEPEIVRILVRESLARLALTRSARLTLSWWEWVYPIGSSALLMVAAMLYQW